MYMKAKDNRGGARPGAGRKPQDPDTKRVQMVISVSRHTRDILQEIYRDMGERPGRVIDRLIKDLEIE